MDKMKWLYGAGFAVVAIAMLWWLLPVGTRTPDPQIAATAARSTDGTGEIALSAGQGKALNLHYAVASAADLMPIAVLPATLVPPPNARVAVAAQLPGIVTRIFVIEGDMVRAGQTLATIASREMVSLGAELSRAQARRTVARANAGRIGQLSREGIIAPARADEAYAALQEAEISLREQARLVGMANGSASGAYVLTAPIGGRISAMNIETGKALDPGAAPFVIDAGGPLQVEAQLPERLIGSVTPGMTVRIGSGVEGKVQAVGMVLDPQTRSATLTARLAGSAPLRAGQSLSVAVMGPAVAGAVQVPGSALAQIAGEDVVFVQSAKGVTVRRIKLAAGGNGPGGERVILSGVKPGERIAVGAISELKALATSAE